MIAEWNKCARKLRTLDQFIERKNDPAVGRQQAKVFALECFRNSKPGGLTIS
jgi:hypothetical protein